MDFAKYLHNSIRISKMKGVLAVLDFMEHTKLFYLERWVIIR